MKQFTCQDIAHEGEAIQGFCLNFGCQDSRPQFCLQCGIDPKKHSNCKKDLKGFGQISSFITNFNQNILDLATELNKSFTQVKLKYEEFSKYLENMKIQLTKISECLNQQDYQQMKVNLQLIKEWYQYLNNQEQIMKQNQIGTQLVRIKRMIKALDLEKVQQQIQDIKQDNENALQQGIQLLNQQKWQEANEKINSSIKLSEKQLSLATLFKSICLIEMNQPGQGFIMREQAKKINNNLYPDLLAYSDQELIKTPQNSYMLLAKSYALSEGKKFLEAKELCEKVQREEPQNLHTLYRKSYSLYNLTQYSEAIQCIELALKYNPQYSIGYMTKGVALDALNKYNEAIVCYDKAIQIDPNYAIAYYNKGSALKRLNKYNEAIVCYDKAIQMDPNYAKAYMNKGAALDDLKNHNEAIVCYDKAIQIDLNYANAYINKGYLLTNMKKYSLAIENYEQAIKYCKSEQDEFKRLIMELKNKK